jgi:ubiquitin-protein ligase
MTLSQLFDAQDAAHAAQQTAATTTYTHVYKFNQKDDCWHWCVTVVGDHRKFYEGRGYRTVVNDVECGESVL